MVCLSDSFTNNFHYDPDNDEIVQRITDPASGQTIQRKMPLRAAMSALRQLIEAIDELTFERLSD